MRQFTTAARPPTPPIEFALDGVVMAFTPPGYAPIMFAANDAQSADGAKQLRSLQAFLDWLGAGLSEEDGEHVLERLRDAADPFDVDDAIEIVNGLLEEIAARPTTPSSDSSPSAQATSSTDGRQHEPSTQGNSVFAEPATSPITS